jgi:hypothetical protein
MQDRTSDVTVNLAKVKPRTHHTAQSIARRVSDGQGDKVSEKLPKEVNTD